MFLYDTTLRDGTQREGLSLSVDDKLKIAHRLDELGIHYLEGGWPGSNPKDAEFFRRIRKERLGHAKIAAFGMTRRANGRCEDDPSLTALLEAETPVVTIVGKSSTLHVERVLEASRDENLRMISDTVGYLRRLGREVIYDAEHFFDGYRLDADYALATWRAAAGAGADCIVLCDTNGGELPEVVEQRVRDVRARLGTPLGIHPHNDSGLAVANALAAVRAGCVHVQGTINGYGERCGNLDLIPLVATLQLKLGYDVLPPDQLRRLTEVAHFVASVANFNPDAHAPYVGASAFAHKGGIHVAAVAKLPESYQHIDPALVGNEMRVVVSELSGRQNVRLRAGDLGLGPRDSDAEILRRVKELEFQGHQFAGADGSFEMLVRRSAAVRATGVHGDRRRAERRAHHGAGDGPAPGGRRSDPHGRRGRGPGERARRRGAQGALAAVPGARRRAAGGLQGAHRGRAPRHRRPAPGGGRVGPRRG